MLDPEASDEARDRIVAEARGRIEAGGEVKQDNTWGVREMAYEIDRRTEADYRFFRFQSEAAVLESLDHDLKIADGVLRFRIFKVDARSPVTIPPAPSPGGATGERPRRDAEPEGSGEAPPPASAAPEAPASAEPAAAAPAAEPTAPAAEPTAPVAPENVGAEAPEPDASPAEVPAPAGETAEASAEPPAPAEGEDPPS